MCFPQLLETNLLPKTIVSQQLPDGILYCFNLNLYFPFRVGCRSPVTFKTELYVTTFKNSFQLLPISFHKVLHLSCCIGLKLNIVTRFTKFLKGIRGHPAPPMIECNALIFLHLISNGLNGVNINSLMQIMAVLQIFVYLVKAQNHMI